MSQPKSSEADRLFEIIEARYGDRVTPEELKEMRRGLEAILDGAKAMRAVKLDNGDEPYQFFRPHRGERR